MYRENTHNCLIVLTLGLFLSSCRSSALKADGVIAPPSNYSPAISEPLLSYGENYGGHFSPDGEKILFISRERTKHKHPQVYELNLRTHKDRRITFQDGEIFDAVYGQKENELIYSSSTDEIKENPQFIRQSFDRERKVQNDESNFKNLYGELLAPSEIYLSSGDGRKIRRLTDSVGFDGQIAIRPRSSEVALLSLHHRTKQLYLLSTSSRGLSPINTRGADDEFPSFSTDGKQLLWSHGIDDSTKSEIWVSEPHGGQSRVLITGNGHHLEPVWLPNNEDILFVSNRDDIINFEIYVAKKDGTCVRRLTYHAGLDRSPQISPDGKKLLFTSNRTGQLQLYLADYSPPPCPAVIEPVQSK